jgi:hypothetical protein
MNPGSGGSRSSEMELLRTDNFEVMKGALHCATFNFPTDLASLFHYLC